jgi:hypothetical protein
MWKPKALIVVLLGCIAACMSINPQPPRAPGTHWERYALERSGPRGWKTSRVALTGTPNLLGPYVLEGSDFRYRLDVDVAEGNARLNVSYNQHGTRGEYYRCEATSRPFTIAFTDKCASGRMSSDGREYSISPWFDGKTLVGFLARDDSRPIAAIDTDHQWTRPVWVASGLSFAERIDIDTLAYVVNDMIEAQLGGGYAFLCGEGMMSALRSPQ